MSGTHPELAQHFTRPRQPAVILMCGLSGTGKTTVARELAATLDAIHVRSGMLTQATLRLGLTESSRDTGQDIYTTEATARTFDRLASPRYWSAGDGR
ncbi:MAG: AAA family ATPase [Gammaproteobacteria bacterium]|nr:AAA family ATPase [Gammaproteobacteria bacterium]